MARSARTAAVIGAASLTMPSTTIGASCAVLEGRDHDVVPKLGAVRRQRGEPRRRRFVAEIRRGDEHRSAGPAEQVADLTHSGARADADDRHARLLASEIDRVDARAVGEQHADARTRCHAGRDERPRESIRARVERAPGEVAVVRGIRNVIGSISRVLGHQPGEGRVTPPAGRAVLGCDLWLDDRSEILERASARARHLRTRRDDPPTA